MKQLKSKLLVFALLILSVPVIGQVNEATKLLGELTPIRENFDVQFYNLDVTIHPDTKSIQGQNTIQFKAVKDIEEIQIDLFETMNVSSITQGNTPLTYERKYNSIFIDLQQPLKKGVIDSITIAYDGTPTVAKNAPWDGGFVWKTDSLGQPWVGVAVEGLGASSWWPNKDHWSDEPDNGVQVSLTVPKGLKGISNGRMINMEDVENDFTKFTWRTAHPIDNYNVTLYVGDYVTWKEYYNGIPQVNSAGQFIPNSARSLDVDYYFLKYHKEQAKTHFDFVDDVLQTFEFAYGPYPFYEDGFAIVEAPFLGMEHQSAIAYGNDFQMGWNGQVHKPYLEFDYLFVHETAHEWWGNNISVADKADMWIQESFATYSDAFYAYSMYGFKGYIDMMQTFKTLVENDRPIIGEHGVRDSGTIDQYYKGALMLSSISQLVESNEEWFTALRKAQQEFAAPKTISTEEFKEFLEEELRLELDYIFDQYLRTTEVPKLLAQVRKENGNEYLIYKWTNAVEDFEMPVRLQYTQYKSQRIYPTTEWKKVKLPRGYQKKFLAINNETSYFDVELKQ